MAPQPLLISRLSCFAVRYPVGIVRLVRSIRSITRRHADKGGRRSASWARLRLSLGIGPLSIRATRAVVAADYGSKDAKKQAKHLFAAIKSLLGVLICQEDRA